MKLPHQILLTADRVVLSIRQRFNPTKSITADSLSNANDEFDRGNLRNAAIMWRELIFLVPPVRSAIVFPKPRRALRNQLRPVAYRFQWFAAVV